jgi:hypothetical protein
MFTKDQEKAQKMYNKLNVIWEELTETSSLTMDLEDEDSIEIELKEELIKRANDHLESLERLLSSAGNNELDNKYLKPAYEETTKVLKEFLDECEFETAEEVKVYLDDAGLKFGYHQECLKQDYDLEDSEED